MKKPIRPIRKVLDKAQREFVRSRSGSVLILVVALLVLMALIGTAYMTMAQFDRVAAAQHTFNTEVDLLLDGVINQVKATVTGDLFVNGQFRQGTPAYNPGTQTGWAEATSSLGLDPGTVTQTQVNSKLINTFNAGTWWIASRTPDQLASLKPPALQNEGINGPWWGFITGALNQDGLFDTPYWPSNKSIRYSTRTNLVPGATASTINGQFMPAWLNGSLLINFSTTASVGNVMAADADGDGIADAGYIKLLTLDGITYYAAIRILDNASAVNATIATRPNSATALNPNTTGAASYTTMPGDFSPVNIDLEGMLISPGAELYNTGAYPNGGLLGYRFNGVTPVSSGIDETTFLNRSDFRYMSDPINGNLFFHQQWTQLGRRMDNPGNIAQGAAASSRYQALSSVDAMALVRNFILCDPVVASSKASSSPLEQCLAATLIGAPPNAAPTTPYQPGDTSDWYQNNFNYFAGNNSTGAQKMPMRALLVPRSQVSNFVPAKFVDKGVNTTGTGAFNFGDMITYPAAGGQRYVCINPNPTQPPRQPTTDSLFQDPNWAYEPWTTAPTKANANTATFQQLYAAYWAVMADQYNTTAAPGVWSPAFDTANSSTGRMFRSPARVPGSTVKLTPAQVMYLRAAIAAVNTMDLRDSDNDVTSRTITIPLIGQGATTAVQATIYGTEMQPYITQVYARNDQQTKNDWVAIEIYNPFPVAIPLTNWQFVAYTRAAKTLTLIAPITTPSIAPQQRLVFVSSMSPPPTIAVNVPANAIAISGLETKGLANEVFLMRPRRNDGTITSSTLLNNTYTESTTQGSLQDLVPVDCYDFSNLPVTAASATAATEWHYVRPNDPSNGKAWHFVYPGPWNISAKTPQPTLGGTAYATNSPTPLPPMNLASLGQPMGTVAKTSDFPGTTTTKVDMVYNDVPLQVANVNFGGPMKLAQPTNAANSAYFPYGGFARNGDLLQVTFIGSYRLTPVGATPSSSNIMELNPITMDSMMAPQGNSAGADTPPYGPLGNHSAPPYPENIGRFCPIDVNDGTGGINDYVGFTVSAPNQTYNALWRYHWAMKLFDYLTVESPQDDYSPQYNPWHPEPTDPSYANDFVYTPANSSPQETSFAGIGPLNIPRPVANATPTIINGLKTTSPPQYNTNLATEETSPINGLININTAPWRVLAAVPWVPATDGAYQIKNAAIAQAIVFYRDINDATTPKTPHGHGPFKSIFELMDVPMPATAGGNLFRNVDGNTNAPAGQGSIPLGDIIQVGQPNSTGVAGDFETMFLALTRVSNLITTRSDSYTAYILVQGWRNAETNNPTLVVQRRAAIIIDRSAVTPTNTSPTVTNVPVE